MISGIGYGKTQTSYDGYPKFIEIYALEDANLSQYRLYDNLTNNYNYAYGWGFINLNIQMKKGERLLLYYGKDYADTYFGSDINEYMTILTKVVICILLCKVVTIIIHYGIRLMDFLIELVHTEIPLSITMTGGYTENQELFLSLRLILTSGLCVETA